MPQPKILVSPLNWGLGHATRCIPIIDELLHLNCEVVIGSNGQALQLLQNHYPNLNCVEMPGVEMFYSKSGNLAAAIAKQSFKYLKSLKQERQATKQFVGELSLNGIISDNRFGVFSKKVPSIFISHQINLIMPPQAGVLSSFVNQWNHKKIDRFSQLWIPDWLGEKSLAGQLSNNDFALKKGRYLGALSRLKSNNIPAKPKSILAVLSGPEPLRTQFEEILRQAPIPKAYTLTLVQGLPGKIGQEAKIDGRTTIIPFMNSAQLAQAYQEHTIIIGRTGYTTVMDLCVLGKKAILVPTPGQTEQEYLANELTRKKLCYCPAQKEFNLIDALEQLVNYKGFSRSNAEYYKEVVREFAAQL